MALELPAYITDFNRKVSDLEYRYISLGSSGDWVEILFANSDAALVSERIHSPKHSIQMIPDGSGTYFRRVAFLQNKSVIMCSIYEANTVLCKVS